jgi:hypothetical protein
MKQCQLCAYWIRENDKSGTCHRNPPQVITFLTGGGGGSRAADGDRIEIEPVDSNAENYWPVTGQTQWCGEFKHISTQVPPMTVTFQKT